MFRDNSLIPAESLRLAALGFLSEKDRHYGDLAAEVRHFTSRVVGPSLELMGTSLELLRYEGLVAAVDGEGMADNATLRLTDAGKEALATLLQASLRGAVGDLNRLNLMLKLRFLHFLPVAQQREQLDQVVGLCENELARLEDLRHHDEESPALFREWLDADIAHLKTRLAGLPQG